MSSFMIHAATWSDAHCHLHDPKFGTQLPEVFRRSETFMIRRWVVNGTHPSDWQAVADLARQHPGVVPQFGLHPWNADKVEPTWDVRLKEMLLRFPEAGVGECGLDRKLTDAPLELQMEQCRAQLQLAQELGRCCTLHVVGAWQELDQILKEVHPRRWLLHSFSGSAEQACRYAEKGAMFSMGGSSIRQPTGKVKRVVEVIPDTQLLLETDAPYQHPEGKEHIQEPAGLLRIAERVASAKGIPVDRLREITEENLSRFLSSV